VPPRHFGCGFRITSGVSKIRLGSSSLWEARAAVDAFLHNMRLTTFTVASNEFVGGGKEKAEYQCKGKV
jgi:hypothetical protein